MTETKNLYTCSLRDESRPHVYYEARCQTQIRS